MQSPYTCVLFDLDGTIADSAPGIISCLAKTFEQLGRPVPSPTEFLAWVGPPILDSFEQFAGMNALESRQALKIYRTFYLDHGITNLSAFDGIGDVLRAVHETPLPISLATSKPESLARIAMSEMGFLDYLDVLTGASEDEVRSAKAEIIGLALERLSDLGADVSRPIMVGDRIHDVEGAAANNIPSIFVEWGYGAPAEQVGSIASVSTADELQSLLLGQRR